MFITRRKYEELVAMKEVAYDIANKDARIAIKLESENKTLKFDIEELTNSLRRAYLNAITQRLQGYDEGYNDGVRDTLVAEEEDINTVCECGCYEEWDEDYEDTK